MRKINSRLPAVLENTRTPGFLVWGRPLLADSRTMRIYWRPMQIDFNGALTEQLVFLMIMLIFKKRTQNKEKINRMIEHFKKA